VAIMAVAVASTPVTNLYGVKPGNLGGQMSLRNIYTGNSTHYFHAKNSPVRNWRWRRNWRLGWSEWKRRLR
jgi:hypothetical protein